MEGAPLQEMFLIRDLSQAMVLLKPLRLEVLHRLDEPRSCPELAELTGETQQKVYYHVKALEAAGLVEKVVERRVGGIMEGVYRARARSYWLAPELVGRIGGDDRARDQMSLGFLLSLAEELQTDVAELAAVDGDTASLGLSADVTLRDEADRDAFLTDIEEAIRGVAERYGARVPRSAGAVFKLVLACYPQTKRSRAKRPARSKGRRRR